MTQQVVSLAEDQIAGGNVAPAALDRILVALDASEYADRALAEAVSLANTADGVITGIHAYAAQLHDRRFRQMEGGLPERYLEEKEMEHQREVHDDLIARGLNIISDSYHDVAQTVCDSAGRPYRRLSPEGKNYRCVVEAAASGDFGVLVLGALGLGAVQGSTIGTVCERVVRRSAIDVLVVKDTKKAIGDGPIVVGLDGSRRSFGALMTALDIGRRLSVPVHAVAAYDPYYHYVAFNKIAGVLSEEAGKVFRFREQEKLHEELIDEGIAKIYQSHLDVAEQIARDGEVEFGCQLLEGKAFVAIRDYVEKVRASLLVVGKIGVHADRDLDIGGNTENLLRLAPCHVWIGQVEFEPPLDIVAEKTIAWSEEAEALLARAPGFVQGMARKAILRSALKEGHSFITANIVAAVASRLMPGGMSEDADAEGLAWSEEASVLLADIEDKTVAENIRLRAEKRAIRDGTGIVEPSHIQHFLGANGDGTKGSGSEVTESSADRPRQSKCPYARLRPAAAGTETDDPSQEGGLVWSDEAEKRLQRIPEGFMRGMTRQRIETFARRHGVTTITSALVGEKYAEWARGSARQTTSLDWDKKALERMNRIPGFVRGMVIIEVERCAGEMGLDIVTDAVIDQATSAWRKSGMFHSANSPNLYQGQEESER